MEATVLSVGKSVLNGALGYAKSALAEEVALQLGVRRDQLFITNELEMMQAFLMAASHERDDNLVVRVWVKQIRDVAYNVEDSLQDFAVRLGRQSWWRIRRTLLDRCHVAKQMKELRANVEDVSQRNMRYHLIKGSGSRLATVAEQSSIATELFSIEGARRAGKMEKSKVDLVQLINKKENDLRVIAVWGTSVDLGQTSIIRAVYDSPDIKSKFPCRAWVRLTHPFNLMDFIHSSVKQFHRAGGANSLLETEKTSQELADEFNRFVNGKRYLIVLNNLSTIEDWDQVEKCFPNNKMGSRIIVSTSQVEVASLCVGQESIVSELKQLSADQNIYAFHEKDSQDGTYLTKTGSSSNIATTSSDKKYIVPNSEKDQSMGVDGPNIVKKSLSRSRTMVASLEESHIIGRVKEKSDIAKLISDQPTQQFQVISVWGMGGLGKTTLIKDIYQDQELNEKFENRAWVTIMRPFSLVELLRSLVMQLDRESYKNNGVVSLRGSTKKILISMSLADLIKQLARILERKSCLFVLDDVSSTTEWDKIISYFPKMEKTSRIIVTTRDKSIATHCSKTKENIYMLEGLKYEDAHGLFTKKVFKKTIDFDKEYPELIEQAKLILKKCNGLPLAIVTIGGFLKNQPKTVLEWRKLNEHISAELEMNPELGPISVLIKSYDGLPYYLKSCFLYMPIFPEDYNVRRRRLVSRWTAEGYSREIRGKSTEEISDSYFMELLSRSMILPSQHSMHSTKGVDSCQVHDLIREIAISKSMEENLVFRLEEGYNLNTQGTARHLAINGNWKGDQGEYENIMDMSRVRSLTVFGKWRSFFLSDKMLLLRVLDLEDTKGLVDHHLRHIGRLLNLRYLSLRGNEDIYHLPHSLGNLSQLETLDIKDTSIVMLPKSIIKLRKLQYLHAGKKEDIYSIRRLQTDGCCPLLAATPHFLSACCLPQVMDIDGGFNWRDACTFACCAAIPCIMMDLDHGGVMVPRGTRKLKALRTLTGVDLAPGDGVLQEIKGMTGLHKLGLIGFTERHGAQFCSSIAGLSCLQSLSIRSYGRPGLYGCLDGMSSPPDNLQNLKLYGKLVKLPEWIRGLKNLVKLKLFITHLSDAETTMKVLGNLPNLAYLHLLFGSFRFGQLLNFHPEAFPSLLVLELECFRSVNFEKGAAPKLELLKFSCASIRSNKLELLKFSRTSIKSNTVVGLPSLSGLKEVVLEGDYDPDELKYLGAELAKNPNRPIYKRV